MSFCNPDAIRASLNTLDDDSLALIVVALCYSSPRFAMLRLKQLSLTSKHMRVICLPLLFKRVRWPSARITKDVSAGAPAPFFPDDTLPFISEFYLDSDGDHTTEYLVRSLPKMTCLSIFTFHCLRAPTDDLVETLLSAKALREIHFEETPLDFKLPSMIHDALSQITVHNGKRLRISGESRSTHNSWKRVLGERAYKEHVAISLHNIDTTTKLLINHRLSLRAIEVPKEFLSYPDLSVAEWPDLRRLSLTGHKPHHPFFSLLRGMPKLQELRLLYSIPSQKAVTSSEHSQHPAHEAEQTPLAVILPCLGALVISNPEHHDPIFTQLPSSLESLTVLSIHDWPDDTEGLSHEEAIWILKAVSSRGASLRELRLALDNEPTAQIISTIAKEAPGLHILQLGMDDYYPLEDVREDQDKILESISTALSPLHALHTLYLGIRQLSPQPNESCASHFFRKHPGINVVGMQGYLQFGRSGSNVFWAALYAIRGDGGAFEVRGVEKPLRL